jgi:hypothetical protein
VPFEGGLAVDQLAVEDDLKAAPGAGEQLDVLDRRGPPGEQLVRQTDGPGNVVSRNAEFDRELVLGIYQD